MPDNQQGPHRQKAMDPAAVGILLVDDDEDNWLLTADALNELKVTNKLTTVSDGEELLDYLNHRGRFAPPSSSPRPGLVLLDLNMPRRDGREALRLMKEDPRFRSIPVVILTTSLMESDVWHTYDLGANSFIVKPSSFEDLMRVLKVAGDYWLRTVELPNAPAEA